MNAFSAKKQMKGCLWRKPLSVVCMKNVVVKFARQRNWAKQNAPEQPSFSPPCDEFRHRNNERIKKLLFTKNHFIKNEMMKEYLAVFLFK